MLHHLHHRVSIWISNYRVEFCVLLLAPRTTGALRRLEMKDGRPLANRFGRRCLANWLVCFLLGIPAEIERGGDRGRASKWRAGWRAGYWVVINLPKGVRPEGGNEGGKDESNQAMITWRDQWWKRWIKGDGKGGTRNEVMK